MELLRESLEKKEVQISEVLKATNLDPSAMSSLTKRLEEVLGQKNTQIKDLQYDLSKVTKVRVLLSPVPASPLTRFQAHNDMIRVYESKLTEFSIPIEELGFRPLLISSAAKAQKNSSTNPSGFVAAQ